MSAETPPKDTPALNEGEEGEDEVVYQRLECVLKGLDRADSLPCGALDLSDALELVV